MDNEERQQFEELLQIHRRRLRELEAQAAKLGLYTPPHVNIEIDDLRTEIAGIQASLGITSTRPAISLAPRRDFYAHIALPPNYITRADLLDTVRDRLTADMQHTGSTPASRRRPAALHGMGGIGKSVIARALCDDPAIRAAFPDGILWATLGQTPDLVARLRELVTALGGTVSENAPTVESLKANLAHLVADRACLLIADDAWQRKHAEAFLVGGPRCRLVITTRDAEIARGLGARILPIPTMGRTEAIALLEEWADGRLASAGQASKEQIVERLGRLPLAVKLAGAQLQHKAPDVWLQTFDARKLKSRRPEDIHDSLEATFGLSLDVLSAAERRFYVALAIFKTDEPIRETGIARLWQALGGMDSDDAASLIDDLAARALLEIAQQSYPRSIHLHDLLQNLMDAELGDDHISAHQAMLDAYRATRTGAGWHTAPDDGYLYDHLTYHLAAVGAIDELRTLFIDQSWLDKRVPQSGYTYDGYLDDLEQVWRYTDMEAQAQIAAEQQPVALIDCLRYTLIRTSINAIAANYVPALVARAVETGLWVPTQALSVATRIPRPTLRTALYGALLGIEALTEQQRAVAQLSGIESALAIEDFNQRKRVLSTLAPHLSEPLLRRSLEVALRPPGKHHFRTARTNTADLETLAPYLKGSLLDYAVEQALAIEHVESRVGALTTLAAYLTGVSLQRVLEAVLELAHQHYRLTGLIALAPKLKGAALKQALDVIVPAEERYRAHMLVALAPRLTGQSLERGLDVALAFNDERYRTWALMALAPKLPTPLLHRGLEVALGLANVQQRSATLVALLPHLSGGSLERTLQLLEGAGERYQAQVLAALAPRLTGRSVEHGLDAALALPHEQYRAQALTALAPYLNSTQLAHALQATLSLSDGRHRAAALIGLVPHLNETQIPSALDAACAFAEEQHHAAVLEALAPRLTEPLLQQALDAALALTGGLVRRWAATTLAPYLSGDHLQRSLDAALTIADESQCISAITALAPYMNAEQRDRVLIGSIEAALSLQQEQSRTQALLALAPYMDEVSLHRALEAVFALTDPWGCAEVIAAFLEQLPEQQHPQLIERANINLVRAIQKSASRREEAIMGIGIVEWRARALVKLASQLTDDLLEQELAEVMALTDEQSRLEMLTVLAPYLSGPLLQRGIEAAPALTDPGLKARALAAFLPHAPDQASQLKAIWQAIAEYLPSLKQQRRHAVLEFCAAKLLFTPPIFSPAALGALAAHIGEICQEWRWL